MPRKKVTMEAAAAAVAALETPPEPAKPKEFEPVDLPLGDRTFTIAPIARRGGARAYDDSADFTIAAMPLLNRMIQMALAGTLDLGLSEDAPTPERVANEAILSLAEQDMAGLVREMKGTLPYLAMIACRGSDPRITEDDVKALAGSPLNPELTEIVFQQIQAERLLETVLTLGTGFALNRA